MDKVVGMSVPDAHEAELVPALRVLREAPPALTGIGRQTLHYLFVLVCARDKVAQAALTPSAAVVPRAPAADAHRSVAEEAGGLEAGLVRSGDVRRPACPADLAG